MEKSYNKLLENNKKWVAEQLALDPDFFNNLANTQNPELQAPNRAMYLCTEILPIW